MFYLYEIDKWCEILKYFVSMVDEATKKTLASIPLLKTRAGPRDGAPWVERLKEEYVSLIKVRGEPTAREIVNHSFFGLYSVLYSKALFTPFFSNALQYVTNNKEADNDWFRLESNKDGTKLVMQS